MAIDLEHARKPNTLVVGICLDCDGVGEVGGPALAATRQTGVKRFLTATGHCDTCGSASTIVPNAVREAARVGVKHAKVMVDAHYKEKSKKGKRRR